MDATHWTGDDTRDTPDVDDRDAPILTHLTYTSYRAQRIASPGVAPARWAALYRDAEAMEARYLAELESRALGLLGEAGLAW